MRRFSSARTGLDLAVILAFVGCGAFAVLPIYGNDRIPLEAKGSSVKFVGESLLHNFEGEVREFSGWAQFDESATPPVQQAVLKFKVTTMTTANSDRDKKMFEWLKPAVHPDITFELKRVKLLDGDMKSTDEKHPAHFAVEGTFTLNDVSRPLKGEAFGWREGAMLLISGKTAVDTLKHALPQIRESFLTVGTTVRVEYRLAFRLPPGAAAK